MQHCALLTRDMLHVKEDDDDNEEQQQSQQQQSPRRQRHQNPRHLPTVLLVLLAHVAVVSSWVLVVRHSRSGAKDKDQPEYLPTTVVFFAECCKLVSWFAVLTWQQGEMLNTLFTKSRFVEQITFFERPVRLSRLIRILFGGDWPSQGVRQNACPQWTLCRAEQPPLRRHLKPGSSHLSGMSFKCFIAS